MREASEAGHVVLVEITDVSIYQEIEKELRMLRHRLSLQKKYFGEINFMTRSHTDKEQLSSMFAFLHTYLKYSGKLNMLDENKVMEDIMCEVLNRVYGWHLVNLNTKEKNYSGIDLGDIQQGLGIQVTADKTSAKIQYTFSKVIAHEVYETYVFEAKRVWNK